jgi:periplasmic protein TonB
LLRADRGLVVRPLVGDPAFVRSTGDGTPYARTAPAEMARVRTGLIASGAGHALLGFALSAAVWHAVPEQSVSSALTMVFAAPADQRQTPVPQREAATLSDPELPQPEPVQPETATAATPDPMEPVPVAPAPDPVQESPPPLPAVEPLQVRPPAAPPSKPVHIAARPPPARPAPSKPNPAAPSAAESVPSVPGAALAPSAAQPETVAVAGWNSLFSAWLAARKTYPEVARRRGEQGSVTLRFKVAGDGTVLEVALLTGSGSPVLDEAARALLRDARLPPPQTEINRTVRLRYRLDD